MRGLNKRGLRDLETMSSYISLHNIQPDRILSSCALRTQLTADMLAQKTNHTSDIHYLDELYLTRPEMYLNVLSLQEDTLETIFLVGHNPTLTELAEIFVEEFSKFPTLGILALKLDIDSWSQINETTVGKIDFFIFPKQFKYYMPQQIRTILKK